MNTKVIIRFHILIIFAISCRPNESIRAKLQEKANINEVESITYFQRSDSIDRRNLTKESNLGEESKGKGKFNAIDYYNKAINLYSLFESQPFNAQDSTLLNKALLMSNKAIKQDTQYYLAFVTKAMILCKLNRNYEAIETLKKILETKHDYAEGFANLGFIYEKSGNFSEANYYYHEAINAYTRRLRDPLYLTDRIKIQADIAFMLYFLFGKEKSLDYIDTLITQNTDNKTLVLMKGTITHLNRQEFISNF